MIADSHVIWLVLLAIAESLQFVAGRVTDRTSTLYNRFTVDVTIEKLDRWIGIGDEDYKLLKRIALVESDFGQDGEVMTANRNGGIWQIRPDMEEAIFSNFSIVSNSSMENDVMEKIYYYHCLRPRVRCLDDCYLCQQDVYREPLGSAEGARLFIELNGGPINRSSIAEQAEWWANYYNTEGDPQVFINKSAQYEIDYGCQDELQVDLWFLFDGSWNMTEEDYNMTLDFIHSVVKDFNFENTSVQLGFSVNYYGHKIYSWFNTSSDLFDFEWALYNSTMASRFAITSEAFETIIEEIFSPENGARPHDEDPIRAIIMITAHKIDDDFEAIRNDAENNNITILSIVVENYRVNSSEVMATFPFAQHTFILKNFDELLDIQTERNVYYQLCRTILANLIISFMKEAIQEQPSAVTTVNGLDSLVKSEFSLTCFLCADQNSSTVKETLEEVYSLNNKVINKTYELELREELIAWAKYHNYSGCSDNLKLDLWFLIDGVDSYSDDDFIAAMEFIDDIAVTFNVSQQTTQIGFSVTFGRQHEIKYNFTNGNDLTRLSSITGTLEKPHELTNIGEAIQEILNEGFHNSSGGRPDDDEVGKFLVVITNRQIPNSNASEKIYENPNNVTVFAVGVALDNSTDEVAAISSNPDNLFGFYVSSFENLSSISVYLLGRIHEEMTIHICDVPVLLQGTNATDILVYRDYFRNYMMYVPAYKSLRLSVSIIEGSGEAYLRGSAQITRPNPSFYEFIYVAKEKVKPFIICTSGLLSRNRDLASYNDGTEYEGNLTIYFTFSPDSSSDNPLVIRLAPSPIYRPDPSEVYAVLRAQAQPSPDEREVAILYSNTNWKAEENEELAPTTTNATLNQTTVTSQINTTTLPSTTTTHEASDEMVIKTSPKLETILTSTSQTYNNETINTTKSCNNSKGRGISDTTELIEFNPNKDFQTEVVTWFIPMATISAISLCIIILLTYKRKKRKRKVGDEPLNTEELHEKVIKELKILSKEATLPSADMTDLTKLEKKLKYAKNLHIPNDHLKEFDDVCDELKMRLSESENVLTELHALSKKSKNPFATMSIITTLKEKLELAEDLHISLDLLEEAITALEALESRFNETIKEMRELAKEGIQPNATAACLLEIKKKISLAESLKIPKDEINELYEAESILKTKLHTVKEDLQKIAHISRPKTASRSTIQKLEQQLLLAETLKISSEKLKKSFNILDKMKHNQDTFIKELRLITEEAKQPTARSSVMRKLEEKLKKAQSLEIPSDQLKEAYDAFNKLKERCTENTKELRVAIDEANGPSATIFTIDKLKNQLKLAEEYQLSSSELKEAQIALENLQKRIDSVLSNLKDFTEKAKNSTVNMSFVESFEAELELAKNLQIESDVFTEAATEFQPLKIRFDKIKEDLKAATEAVNNENATSTDLKALEEQLKLTESLGFSQDILKESIIVLQQQRQHHNTILCDLQTITEEANSPAATTTTLINLEHQLKLAAKAEISKEAIKEAQNALKSLKDRIAKVKSELNNVVEQATNSAKPLSMMKELEFKTLEAERLEIPPLELADAYNTMNHLRSMEGGVKTYLEILSNQESNPDVTYSILDKLKNQIEEGKQLGIPEEELQEHKKAYEDIKKRFDTILAELQSFTEEANKPNPSGTCFAELKSKLLLAKSLKLPSDQLQPAIDALDNLKKNSDQAIVDLNVLAIEAKQPNATVECMMKLKEQIEKAENSGTSAKLLEDAYEALEFLKNRIDQVINDLKAITEECNESNPSSIKKLEEQLEKAEKLKIPQEQLAESYKTLELARSRSNDVVAKLNAITEEAKMPSANFSCIEELEKAIKEAEDLGVSFDKLKNSYDALEDMKIRYNSVIADLNTLCDEAEVHHGSASTMQDLQEQIALAESLGVPSDQLLSAKEKFEKLQSHANEVSIELQALTKEAIEHEANFAMIEKLEHQLENAQEIELSFDQLQSSYDALNSLKHQYEMIIHDLEACTDEATHDHATASSVEKLKKQIEVAQSFGIPYEKLKDSIDAAQILQERIDKALNELDTLTDEISGSNVSESAIEELQKKLAEAERFHLPHERLQKAYDILSKQKFRKKEIIENIKYTTEEANDPTKMFMCREKLENLLAEAEGCGISVDDFPEAKEKLAEIYAKLDEAKKLLQEVAQKAKQPHATFNDLQNLQHQLSIATAMHMPPENLEEATDAMTELKTKIESATEELVEMTKDASSSNADESSIEKLEKKIEEAEQLQLPSHQIDEARDVLNKLKSHDDKVKRMKIDLEKAMEEEDFEDLSKVLDEIDQTENVLSWNKNDDEFSEMLAQAKELHHRMVEEGPARKVAKAKKKAMQDISDLLKIENYDDVDEKLLEKLIKEFKEMSGDNMTQAEYDSLRNAERVLIDILRYKCLLKITRATQYRDGKQIHEAIDNLNFHLQEGLKGYDVDGDAELKAALDNSYALLDLFDQLEKMKSMVLSLKQPTISEIRSYSHPPPAMRNVMVATYLLLGEPLAKLQNWKEVQALVGKTGRNALKYRVAERDLSLVKKSIANRAYDLIHDLDLKHVQELSKAVAVFFEWATCVVKELRHREDA